MKESDMRMKMLSQTKNLFRDFISAPHLNYCCSICSLCVSRVQYYSIPWSTDAFSSRRLFYWKYFHWVVNIIISNRIAQMIKTKLIKMMMWSGWQKPTVVTCSILFCSWMALLRNLARGPPLHGCLHFFHFTVEFNFSTIVEHHCCLLVRLEIMVCSMEKNIEIDEEMGNYNYNERQITRRSFEMCSTFRRFQPNNVLIYGQRIVHG